MDWSTVTIGDYLVKTELRDPTKQPGNRFFYVDVSSVDNQAFAIRQPTELLGADAPSRARKVIRERDVLFATVRPTLRRIALVHSALDDQICSTGFCVLRPGAKLDARFLYYWLLTDDVVQHVAKIEKGVSYPSIRDSDVKAIRIPYPPLDEQRQIAAVLTAVQEAIERQERLVGLSAELKKALMHKLFTKGTRGAAQKQTEIGPVPGSWAVTELEAVSEPPQYGFTASAQSAGNARILRITDIEEAGIDWTTVPYCDCPADELANYRLHTGDVVFARIGATTGKNLLVIDPPEPTVFASYLIRVRARKALIPEFLAYFCQTAPYWRQIAANKGNNLKGGFNSSLLRRMLIPLPPDTSEQLQIANVLGGLDRKIDIARRTSVLLKAGFRTLLHKLMTGQIRVHDLDLSALDEVEQEPVGAV